MQEQARRTKAGNGQEGASYSDNARDEAGGTKDLASNLLRTTKEAISASSALRLSATACLAYLRAVGVESQGSDETRESNAYAARPKAVRREEVLRRDIQGEVGGEFRTGRAGGRSGRSTRLKSVTRPVSIGLAIIQSRSRCDGYNTKVSYPIGPRP